MIARSEPQNASQPHQNCSRDAPTLPIVDAPTEIMRERELGAAPLGAKG